jgi:hypothetical protein
MAWAIFGGNFAPQGYVIRQLFALVKKYCGQIVAAIEEMATRFEFAYNICYENLGFQAIKHIN